ncbi:transposase [Catenuloplanes sp. NPDC051500]|uniref:transposase n=1 Tax=Catenuloplanes sp. NPDC051500 TaxID=3363959 RepID=UPI0037A374C4
MMIHRCLCVAGDLANREWERLAPLLPDTDPQRGGRWRDHRQLIDGMLWRIENGARSRQVPKRYGLQH